MELCKKRFLSLQGALLHINKSALSKNKSKSPSKIERAHAARLDITQVTCLLFFLLTLLLTSESRSAAEVSVCFTQRHTLLSLPQELSTLTIPITPRPPETAVFITEPLLCAANKVSPLRDCAQRWSYTERQRGRGREVWSEVDEVSWLLAVVMPLFTASPSPFWSRGALYMSEQKVNACWERVYKEIRI